MLASMGTRRDLANFEWRMVITASAESRSSRSKPTASPMRMPVAASSPIRVSTVLARSGVGTVRRAADINAAMSAAE